VFARRDGSPGGAREPAPPVSRERFKAEQLLRNRWKWKDPAAPPYRLVLAGDTVFAGGDDQVAAYRADNGDLLWTGKIAGRAYGLAVAAGCLFVSTDQGAIYCFAKEVK
jgi:outer membrane protein assembly factor BamB